MLFEILGGALLGSALAKGRRGGSGITTSSASGRYAVGYEIKRGKGVGTAAIVYLTDNYQDAMKWAESAAMCMAGFIDGCEYISNIAKDGNVVGGYRASGTNQEVVYCVIKF